MSYATKIYAALLLLFLVTVETGGRFLLRILSGEDEVNPASLTFSLFRAGHAHAGVLAILALVALMYVDQSVYGNGLQHAVRLLLAAAPLLMAAGFFAGGGFLSGGMLLDGKPGPGIAVTTIGTYALGAGLILLAGLFRKPAA